MIENDFVKSAAKLLKRLHKIPIFEHFFSLQSKISLFFAIFACKNKKKHGYTYLYIRGKETEGKFEAHPVGGAGGRRGGDSRFQGLRLVEDVPHFQGIHHRHHGKLPRGGKARPGGVRGSGAHLLACLHRLRGGRDSKVLEPHHVQLALAI